MRPVLEAGTLSRKAERSASGCYTEDRAALDLSLGVQRVIYSTDSTRVLTVMRLVPVMSAKLVSIQPCRGWRAGSGLLVSESSAGS